MISDTVYIPATLSQTLSVIEEGREESLWQNGTHREARYWNAVYNGVCCSKALKPDSFYPSRGLGSLVYKFHAVMLLGWLGRPMRQWFHQCRYNALQLLQFLQLLLSRSRRSCCLSRAPHFHGLMTITQIIHQAIAGSCFLEGFYVSAVRGV